MPQTNLTDLQLIEQCAPNVRHRRKVELTIVHELIQRLTAAGYSLRVDDGEGCPQSGNEQELINAAFGVDEAHLLTLKEGKLSSVFLVFGNDGPDVISDYGMSLEPIMAPLNAWIEEQEAAGAF